MRNIRLAYLLTMLHYSWFWLGIWVLYYLRFTNYAGIGIIETVMILSTLALEIPTGAIADLFGKKITLTFSFFFNVVGYAIGAQAMSVPMMALATFFMCVGGTLLSGTMDALVYDSLKQQKKLDRFAKVIANIGSAKLLSLAVASIIGGVLYSISPRLPYMFCAGMYSIGVVVTLFLQEPKVDTFKFSLQTFFTQNARGFTQLFRTESAAMISTTLLITGIIFAIVHESVNDLQAVELGFTDKQLGIYWAGIFLVSAIVSQIFGRIKHGKRLFGFVYLLDAVLIATLIASPYVGLILGGGLLALRVCTQTVFENLTSATLNDQVDSKYRATTLSTFSMLANVPYVFVAYYIGVLMDKTSARGFAFTLGLLLIAAIVALRLLKPHLVLQKLFARAA